MLENINQVTIGEALVITLFSMAIVFAILLIISFILKGFKSAFYEDKRNKVNSVKAKTQKETTVANENVSSNNSNSEDEEELVAVITAALAASLSRPASDIKIRKIRRLNQGSSIWARAGRLEQMK